MSVKEVLISNINSEYIDKNYERLLSLLCAERRDKTTRYNNKAAAYASVTAGMLMLFVLCEKYKLTAAEIHVDTDMGGKPHIRGFDSLHYNISHSGGYVVCAYGDEPMGIDIERIRTDEKDIKGNIRNSDLRVARRCFTADELAYVMAEEDGRAERFFTIWTMKESYLKLTGQGISVPLNSFETDAMELCVKQSPYRYRLFHKDDYIVTLCAENVEDVVMNETSLENISLTN